MASIGLWTRFRRGMKSRSIDAGERLSAPRVKDIALPHAAQVGEHRSCAPIPYSPLMYVQDRLNEARALQQARRLTRIDHWQETGRNTVVVRHLCREKTRAQRRERCAPHESREEDTSRLQHLPDLDERARQIVDAVQAGRRQHRIETAGCERQAILVAHHAAHHFCKMKTSIGRNDFAFGQQRGKAPIMRPEIENTRKRWPELGEALCEIGGKRVFEEREAREIGCGTITGAAAGCAVERFDGV